jgi:DMSO/TMAO reductase YedYZ molybdopterin-dependent catalytic subunit
MTLNRRRFIRGSLFTGAGLVVGCGDDSTADPTGGNGGGGGIGGGGVGGAGGEGGGPVEMCDDPFAGGQLLGTATFTENVGVPFNTKVGTGWDARLYYDLSALATDNLVVPNEHHYIRTERPDLLMTAPADWTIQVGGLATATTLTMADLTPLAQSQGIHVLECSGNGGGGGFGLLSAAEWGGVPFSAVLDMIDVDPSATRVLVRGFDDHSTPSIGGHSTPGAAWIFTFDDLLNAGAFLATTMNGELLPPDHGEPVRLFIPGWYGCCNIKWANEIEFVDESAPATGQMMEFASRTHQLGTPTMAAQYKPATMDQAAMPVRIEKWLLEDGIAYRVVGILWGGYGLTDKLLISYDGGSTVEPVDVCPTQSTNQTWTLWSHMWRPPAAGDYDIAMEIDDPNVPTIRLDLGWYDREVFVDEV